MYSTFRVRLDLPESYGSVGTQVCGLRGDQETAFADGSFMWETQSGPHACLVAHSDLLQTRFAVAKNLTT